MIPAGLRSQVAPALVLARREARTRWRSGAFWASTALMIVLALAGVATSLASLGRAPGQPGDVTVLIAAGTVLALVQTVSMGWGIAHDIADDRASGAADIALPVVDHRALLGGTALGAWVVSAGQVLLTMVISGLALVATGQADPLRTLHGALAFVWAVPLTLSSLALLAVLVARAAGSVRAGGEAIVGGLLSVLWAGVPLAVGLVAHPHGGVGQVLSYLPGISAVAIPHLIVFHHGHVIEPLVALLITLVVITVVLVADGRPPARSLHDVTPRPTRRLARMGAP